MPSMRGQQSLPSSRLWVATALFLWAQWAWAQARPSVSQLYVQFRAARNQARPSGELAQRLAELEKRAIEAYRQGWSGEARRWLAQGLAMVEGKPWSAVDDYRASLVLRTDTTVADPSQPFHGRLGQIYRPDYVPQSELSLELRLEKPRQLSRTSQPGEVIKRFPRLYGVARDLVDSPFVFELDFSDVPSGTYRLAASLLEDDSVLAEVATPVILVEGFHASRAEITRAVSRIDGHESAKASILYPFDFARRVNLGEMPPGSYDFGAAIRRSRELLAALERGKDPVWQGVGLQRRHYLFREANTILPYGLYVPTSYDPNRAYPLLIGLHGLGGDEWSFWQAENGLLARLAETHGYIVATPLGYNRTSPYGRTRLFPDPAQRRQFEWSEKDVLNVLELVRKEYHIDDSRIYLMGHSMGGGGTWHLAAQYPHLWAAIAPIAPGFNISREEMQRLRHIPVLLTHGDQDVVVPVETSRRAVEMMKDLGMTYVYLEIPGGTHSSVLADAWNQMFAFFSEHKKNP